jgi:hypothetical protein
MQPQTASFFRFVNDDDIVARVPPTYHHVGRLIHFDAAGNVPTGPETPGGPDARARQETIDSGPMLNEAEFDRMRAQLLEARSRRRAPGLEALEAPNVEGLLPSISDHSLDSYISKIAERVGLDPAG